VIKVHLLCYWVILKSTASKMHNFAPYPSFPILFGTLHETEHYEYKASVI